jgi:pimeloyl-ACP methyl ester carboxylesterase
MKDYFILFIKKIIFFSIISLSKTNFLFLRPQTPQSPYPYIVENDVEFRNYNDNIKLSGTLTYSNITKQKYCVVLAHASGGNNRDAELALHKTFLVLGDYLTRRNITVLRFDERGISKSGGNFMEARFVDFSNDILAGIDYMKQRKEFKTCKFGIIGHSKGGMTAMLAANNSKNVEFIVLLGSPATDLESVFLKQTELVHKAFKKSDEEIEKHLEYNRLCFELIKRIDDRKELKKALLKVSTDILKNEADDDISMLSLPWFKDALLFNCHELLKNIKIPVLGIYGSLDIHVLPDENMIALNNSLIEAGNKNFKLIKFKNLNHLFQTAKTGSPLEFGLIRETISPKVLKEISRWINSHLPQ